MILKQNSGYTLVEIILAIAILGLVLVPVLTFMSNSSGIITHADVREMALLIAQQRMEVLKSNEYDSISIGTSNYQLGDSEFPNYNTNRYPDFTITEEISLVTDDLKEIKLIVNWDSKNVQLKSKYVNR